MQTVAEALLMCRKLCNYNVGRLLQQPGAALAKTCERFRLSSLLTPQGSALATEVLVDLLKKHAPSGRLPVTLSEEMLHGCPTYFPYRQQVYLQVCPALLRIYRLLLQASLRHGATACRFVVHASSYNAVCIWTGCEICDAVGTQWLVMQAFQELEGINKPGLSACVAPPDQFALESCLLLFCVVCSGKRWHLSFPSRPYAFCIGLNLKLAVNFLAFHSASPLCLLCSEHLHASRCCIDMIDMLGITCACIQRVVIRLAIL